MELTQEDKQRRRLATREYWQRHGIDEGADGSQQEEVVIGKRPLRAMLSLRLGDDDLRELTLLARENEVGVTTMARKLLRESIREPRSRLSRRQDRGPVLDRVAERAGEPYVASEGQDGEFYLLSRRALDDAIGAALEQGRLLAEAVVQSSVPVDAARGELYDRLREADGPE